MTDQPVNIAAWLAVPNGAAAIEFYRRALGAVDLYRLDEDGDGNGSDASVQVAQLDVGGALFWLQQDAENAPTGDGVRSVRLLVTVDDPDSWFARAVGAGATEVAGVHDAHGWRTGRVRDPFGYDWEFSKQL